jgi:hypothetical protein
VHLILAASSDPFATENNPVVRWFMAFASFGGALFVIRGLRRARSWMLLASGVKTTATVTRIEYCGSNGEQRPLRRPVVSFTTAGGQHMTTAPALYRPRCAKAAGDAVDIRYAARNPERVAVSGFDFHAAEVLPIALGTLVTVVTVWWSLSH